METQKELLKKELIGLNIRVLDSKNKDYIGIEGKLIDETQNSMVILHKGRRKAVLKSACCFEVEKDGKKFIVEGAHIMKRPQERIKAR